MGAMFAEGSKSYHEAWRVCGASRLSEETRREAFAYFKYLGSLEGMGGKGEAWTTRRCVVSPDFYPDRKINSSDNIGWFDYLVDILVGTDANKVKGRSAMFPLFEYFLVSWIDAAAAEHVYINDDAIREQGKIIQKRLTELPGCKENYESFDMSSGWLQGFKQRHNVVLKKKNKDLVDPAEIPGHQMGMTMQLEKFAPRDRFNCSDLRLELTRLPETVPDRRRVTVFLCVNADGSEKRRVLVVNRVATPLSFSQEKVNPANLPVIYRYSQRPWYTGLWYDFLRTFDTEIRAEKRHAVLLCQTSPSYPPPTQPPHFYKGPPPPVLTNITLIFLPSNLPMSLQPLDQGIIACFKATYRRMYVQALALHRTLTGADRSKLTHLECIGIIASAWQAIPPRTILRCWQASGICQDLMREEVAEEFKPERYIHAQESWCGRCVRQIMPHTHGEAFRLFWQLDESLPSEGTVPDAVRLIDEAVAAGVLEHGPDGINLNDVETGAGDPMPEEIISNQTAIKYLSQVNRYLRSLPETELRVPQGRSIPTRGAIEHHSRIISGVFQYVIPLTPGCD